jgi:hypothetical protein
MEWQAGFACGALLMPKTALTTTVTAFRKDRNIKYSDIGCNTDNGKALIATVMTAYQVSRDAATIRLKERHVIVDHPGETLFP